MDFLLYAAARCLIALLGALPLETVARIGRAGGAFAHLIDKRHRNVARENMTRCFPEKSADEIRSLVNEHFKRLGENYCCAVKTSFLSDEQVRSRVEVVGTEKFPAIPKTGPRPNLLVAIGHFGNFEVYARARVHFNPGQIFATTYRGVRQPGLDRLVRLLRERSGCLFFERRTQADELKALLNQGGVMLGLLSDQHGGDKGVRIPFLGLDCSTTPAPAVLAQRYNASLFTSVCFRQRLGYWRIEVGDEIPTMTSDGKPRPAAEVMLEVNRFFEEAVRRDPANWFWVHRRWKPAPTNRA
jgi:KDO2-lipid IV(A) lauroyltransferase